MLSDCKTLDDYFRDYGEVLGARAVQALAPLHVPGRDPILPGVAELNEHAGIRRNSQLFEAQQHVLCGTSKAWRRQKAVILSAECGTGKSLMGAAASHLHAMKKAYRGLVMCPDHLISKWKREILDTCPGAAVRSFEDWREVLAYAQSAGKPTGPEWLVLGRDQSKGDPAWEPKFAVRRNLTVDHKTAQKLILKGATLEELSVKVACCPRCGQVVEDKDGNPISADNVNAARSKLTCKGSIVRHRQKGDESEEVLTDCNEKLWQFVAARTPKERKARRDALALRGAKQSNAPFRWAPYRIVKTKMRKLDFLILDEMHELKGQEDVAQANAAGALIAAARKVIAMTGTLIGGYADHLFPILFRLAPSSLVEAGFEWNGFVEFNARYGRIETTIHTTDKPASAKSNSHSKGTSTRVSRRCRPGIMPQFFGDHLIDKVVFLTLEEVSEGLPALTEIIIPVPLDDEQEAHYRKLESWFRDVIKMMLVKGDKRLLGKMLSTLLAYPDYPYEWTAIQGDDDEFTPANLRPEVLRPKEQALIELCSQERALGRQTWVYLTMTDIRDCGARLVDIMDKWEGLRVGYMKSSVDRRKREEWIYKKGRTLDVVLSHPKLVETGLDLFAKDGNHNYATLAFQQSGYNLFVMRQASRRSWRIGQPLPCKTAFLYYANTMQEQAMTLMGKKMAAAEALEGKFSAEGLAAMAGDDDATMALARALVDRVTVPADRAWSRSLGFDKKAEAVIQAPPAPLQQPSPFSETEIEMFQRLYAQLQGA